MADGAEQARLDGDDAEAWKRWGPYLSERAWGTVREDYSADGDAWSSFPHDHARSRTYRWNEDGLAGLSDDRQILCFSLALWNGADPILKERAFGLTGPEGNHGEDVKEYWWYVDSTPTHSWMRWRYAYPQAAFPYERLVEENARRGRHDPEFELLDTGVFDEDRYFDVEVDFAKAGPDDVCIRITAANHGPDEAVLHLLPTLWFRDTWTWTPEAPVPSISLSADGALDARHPDLGRTVLAADGDAEPLFCDNATNARRLWGADGPAYPKDGIGDHVISGAETVNPDRTGTKAALHRTLTIPAGGTAEMRLRLVRGDDASPDLGDGWSSVLVEREAEADAFYADLTTGASTDEAHVVRSAMAGMLWSKQFYAYSVRRWLDGDPGQPTPPAQRRSGRNHRWRTFHAATVVSMPDPWEYPWFAAWDLAFHCVTLAHVDPAFAKQQLAMVVGDGWMHPTGQIPAYEYDFGAVNPPVQAWAALHVFRRDGSKDLPWLRQVFERLTVNFTWWVAKNDPEGDGAFTGGFLGMDNIAPFDRGQPLPDGYDLTQADATGWMAFFALNMLEIAVVLSETSPSVEDIALMFFELFSLTADAAATSGLWHEDDGWFYDQLTRDDGSRWPVQVKAMTGLVPLFATIALDQERVRRLPRLVEKVRRFAAEHPEAAEGSDLALADRPHPDGRPALLALVDRERLRRMMSSLGDEQAMLSPHGVRSVSAEYRGAPYVFHGGTDDATTIDYEPAESTVALFGGNSNWRGPVWLPVNYLLQQALRRYQDVAGEALVEYPVGSGLDVPFAQVAADISARLTRIYLPGPEGARPVWGGQQRFRTDPRWRDALLFFEYHQGDDGAGLGASHQTGWTGLVANLVLERVRDERHES